MKKKTIEIINALECAIEAVSKIRIDSFEDQVKANYAHDKISEAIRKLKE